MPSSAAEAIRKGPFDLDIKDNVSGNIIRRLESCTLASGSAGFSAGQLVSKRISGRSINTSTGGKSNG